MPEGMPSPAAGIVVVQTSGLGVETKPPLDPFGVWQRRRRKNQVPGMQWFSPIAYYLGSFDDHDGLQGSVEFFRRANNYGKPPQIYLIATESALGIIPTQNWMMVRGRGKAQTLWTPYVDIKLVELEPATKDRMPVMLPTTAYQLGQVVILTKDNRKATLSGTTVSGLSAFLTSLGARIQD